MRLLASDAPVPPELRGAVIALGNFDGFHRGHAQVIGRAVARARAEGRPAIVATFDPHPAHYFRPRTPSFRLTTIRQRAELFARAGADATLVLHFDAALAAMDPATFVRAMLVERFGAGGVVTGEDFTFGHDRAGTVATLAALGEACGITVDTVAPVADADGVISSTRTPHALRCGDCATATALIGRPFAIRGPVVHGAALGRTIGYPTANIVMRDYLRARYGIYAVRVTLDDGQVFDGAANLGIRPSIDPPLELLEPYLFDFSGDLYDREIEVALIAFLRPEAKFDSLDALTAQIARDCDEARRILARLD